jgi:hypothetical protein
MVDPQTSAQQEAPADQILENPEKPSVVDQQHLLSAQGRGLARAEYRRNSQELQLELLWKEVAIKGVGLAAELLQTRPQAAAAERGLRSIERECAPDDGTSHQRPTCLPMAEVVGVELNVRTA